MSRDGWKCASEEDVGADSGCATSLKIALLVADIDGVGHVDVVLVTSFQEEPWRGFTVWPRERRAVKDVGDRYAAACKLLDHESCRPLVIGLGEIAALDARLVGDDNDKISLRLCFSAKIEYPVDEDKVLRLVHISSVDVDRAVSVEKKGFVHHLRLSLLAIPVVEYPSTLFKVTALPPMLRTNLPSGQSFSA